MGEQLLDQGGWRRDQHRRLLRGVIEQLLNLGQLEFHPGVNPNLTQQVVVVRGEVDRIDYLIIPVAKTAGVGEEDDLHRLHRVDELAGRRVGVHVDKLTARGNSKTGENRYGSRLDYRSNQLEMNLGGLTDEPIALLIDNSGVKSTLGEAVGRDSLGADCFDQLDVLRGECVPGNVEDVARCDPEPVDLVALDSDVRQGLVELWAASVEDDRGETDCVEEGQRCCGLIETIPQDGASDLDDCEPRLVDRREPLEIGADLFPVAHVGEQLDDRLANVAVGGHQRLPTNALMIAF